MIILNVTKDSVLSSMSQSECDKWKPHNMARLLSA
jgi:hypothetical protein